MPANHRRQAVQSPASPTSQPTSKYTNKDGSKFITIPKVTSPIEDSETSPAMAQTTTKTNGQGPAVPAESNGTVAVNRKKQKRRQKQAEQAARIAAEQSSHGVATNGVQRNGHKNGTPPIVDQDYELDPTEGDRPFYSDEEGDTYSGSYEHSNFPGNGYTLPQSTSKSSKKKKKGKNTQQDLQSSSHRPPTLGNLPRPPVILSTQPGMSKEKIWNTSTQEDRERIKEFWLSLGEEERRSLVKIEKDAVLKKMKEQQKQSCSCTVCGRKRLAIEEELEVLYDAYYDELEQYANNQRGDGRPPPMMSQSRRFGQISGLQPPHRLPQSPAFNGQQPSRGRMVEHFADDHDEEEDEQDVEEDYSDEEGDDYSDEEEQIEVVPRNHATDFFNFGQSLTVQGGILTVADDLLKNDGKKFIEMMEQLAERRMAREEDSKEQSPNGYGHASNRPIMHNHPHTHNHPPQPDEEEYDDEEEDEEYDSQDEDDYDDEEEMDTMTEEQRMEEGRRMFQIFAARMFEQRVLSAYKEKVAAERREKLLQELDEETQAAEQKKAKKAKDAQKKKEKAQQKKLALAEEKAKRDAEKAAEEAALRAAEDKKADEARMKAEEKRKKREAQKKAEEDERLRKETEKQRRLQDARERQAEVERKAREAKERDRKEKDELRQREKEAKELKDKEARERKERLERGKREQDTKAKAERMAKEQHHPAPQPAVPVQIAKRPQQVPVPIPVGLQSHPSIASPHVTPAVPKAPTPNKATSNSQRDPNSVPQTPLVGSSTSKCGSPNPTTPQQTSPGPILGKGAPQQPFLHHPQATSPIHSTLKSPPGMFSQHGLFNGMQPMGMNGFQPGMPIMGPGFGGRIHHDPVFAHQQAMNNQQQVMNNQFRPLSGPNGMPLYPTNGMPMPQGRGFPAHHPPPGFQHQIPNGGMGGIGQPFGGHKEPAPLHVHSRQQSASFEKSAFDGASAPTQPIGRPAPIGRPSSIVQGQRAGEHNLGVSDIEDLTNHLGSSALIEDSDEAPPSATGTRRASAAPGMGRQGFVQPMAYGMDPSVFSSPMTSYNTWGAGPSHPFGTSSLPGSSYMGGWPNAGNFGPMGGAGVRPSQPRSVAVRLMLCSACKNLEGTTPDDFYSIDAIRDQIERMNSPRDDPISDKELLDLCETEGNPNNGGGYFDIRNELDGRQSIRYEPDAPTHYRSVGAPGDIGSPIANNNMGPSRFGPPGIPGHY